MLLSRKCRYMLRMLVEYVLLTRKVLIGASCKIDLIRSNFFMVSFHAIFYAKWFNGGHVY
jgi:hypothetical protein